MKPPHAKIFGWVAGMALFIFSALLGPAVFPGSPWFRFALVLGGLGIILYAACCLPGVLKLVISALVLVTVGDLLQSERIMGLAGEAAVSVAIVGLSLDLAAFVLFVSAIVVLVRKQLKDNVFQ